MAQDAQRYQSLLGVVAGMATELFCGELQD